MSKHEDINDFINSMIDSQSSTSEEDKDYYQTINDAFLHQREQEIHNGLPEHARVILALMFSNAQSEVKILSNTLAGTSNGTEVYSWTPLVNAIKSFLDKKEAKLKILIRGDNIDQDSEAYKLFEKYENKVEIRYRSKKETDITYNDAKCDFAITDQSSIRIETDTTAGKASVWVKNLFLHYSANDVFEDNFKAANTEQPALA